LVTSTPRKHPPYHHHIRAASSFNIGNYGGYNSMSTYSNAKKLPTNTVSELTWSMFLWRPYGRVK